MAMLTFYGGDADITLPRLRHARYSWRSWFVECRIGRRYIGVAR